MRRPRFVRAKNPRTGHEFDVVDGYHLLRKGLVVRVKPVRYPPSPVPRPAKHHIDLAATAVRKPEPAGEGEPPDKEQS